MRKVLIFFLDGFAYSYLSKVNFLHGVCDQVSPLETLLSYSSGILPAIWSGTYPDENGVWTEFYFSPRKKYRMLKFFQFIPDRKIKLFLKYVFLGFCQRFGSFRETLLGIPENIEYLFRRNLINYWTFPPVKLKDIATFDELLDSNNIPYQFKFYKHEPKMHSILKAIEDKKKDFDVFIYSIGLCDLLGHEYGPKPRRFRGSIEKLEKVIIEAYDALSKEYDTSLVVFSDHGMTQIDDYLDLEEQLQEFNLGQDFLMFLDSTIARFWFFNKTVQDKIIDLLEKCKKGSTLTSHKLKTYGLDFKDNRYGETIFVTKPGTVIFPSFMDPRFLSQEPTELGMHGYVPEEPSTRGIFMCNSEFDLELEKSTHVTQVLNLLLKILGNSTHEK